MSARMFSGEQKAKLTQIINEGMAVLQEIEDLNAGLNTIQLKLLLKKWKLNQPSLKKLLRLLKNLNLVKLIKITMS